MEECLVPVYCYTLYVERVDKKSRFNLDNIKYYKETCLGTKKDNNKLYLEGWNEEYGYLWLDNPTTIHVEERGEGAFCITMFSLNSNAELEFREKCIQQLIFKFAKELKLWEED